MTIIINNSGKTWDVKYGDGKVITLYAEDDDLETFVRMANSMDYIPFSITPSLPKENSAHSFTEGSDVSLKPTIDQQIKAITDIEKRLTQKYDISRQESESIRAIKENLIAIKRWNESPVYHNVDVEKVIEDLIEYVKPLVPHDLQRAEYRKSCLQNAEAALGMLQAFKEKRDTPPKWTKEWAQVTTESYKGNPNDVYKIDEVGLTAKKPEKKLTTVEDFISVKQLIVDELYNATFVQNRFHEDSDQIDHIEQIYMICSESLAKGNKIIAFGNGGSMSDAMHFASELTGRYRGNRDAIAAVALSDPSALTCIANDFGYNQVFKRQLQAIGKEGDVVLALSTSGNSENVLVAAEYAKRAGMKVVSICGNSGGQLKQYCDLMVEIPHKGTADRVQELTILVIHILVSLIEKSIKD